MPDLPVLWELCERSLSLDDVEGRPSPGEWVAELEHVLDVLSARALGAAVREAQGDPRPGNGGAINVDRGDAKPPVAATAPVPDVTVRPVLRRRPPSTWQLINGYGGPPLGAVGGALGGAACCERCELVGRAWRRHGRPPHVAPDRSPVVGWPGEGHTG